MVKLLKSHTAKILTVMLCMVILATTLYNAIFLSVTAADNVKIIFNDTFNKTSQEISGKIGSEIPFPTDPTDANNKNWFMGWYTDEACKTEFTNTVFGDTDVTLYSKWASEYVSASQNFENYKYDSFKVLDSNGNKTKSNRNSFFEGMVKQSDVTFSGNYAIKTTWDSTMTKIPEDPATYDAAKRYSSNDQKLILTTSLEDGVAYNVTFKYKFEKADTDVSAIIYTAQEGNIWAFTTNCGSFSLNTTSTEWQEASYTFTNCNTTITTHAVYLVFRITENKDYTVYVDDFVFTPVMQPSDSTVTIVPNNGEDNEIIIGKRGESFTLPELKNGDRNFLGWYSDEELTVPFEYSVYQRKGVTAYAKWSAAPLTFDKEPMSNAISLRAVYTVFLKEGDGIGYSDNYALNFFFDGDATYQYVSDPEPIKFSQRANSIDNVIKVAKVNNGALYKITFMRKSGEKSESDFTVKLLTADNNIWTAGRLAYDDTAITVKSEEKEWVQETIYFSPNITVATANYLYLMFNSTDLTDASYVDGYVDNVLVEEVTGDIVYFKTNSDSVKDTVVSGKSGDKLEIPVIDSQDAPFLGWYSDKELTTPFTADTIPEGTTIVYAKWGSAPINFRNYTYEFKLRSAYTLSVKNSSKVGLNDDFALNFNYDADATYQFTADPAPIKFVDRYNTIDNVARIGTAISGKVYKLTYYRKASSDTNADYTIVPATGRDNIWSGEFISYDGAKVICSYKDKDWVKETVYFIPSFTNEKSNLLYLRFNCTSDKETSYVDVYVDNVSLEEVTDTMIFFDGNAVSAKDTVFFGKIGDTIEIPTPTNGRNTFLGWYTDKELTIPFTATTIEKQFTIVYAKWGDGPIAFDIYKQNFNTTAIGQFGRTMSIVEKEGYGYDDEYALNFNFKGSDPYVNPDGTVSKMYERAQLTHIAKLGTGENGVAYRITYKYRINKANIDFKMRLYSASDSNVWSGSKLISTTEFTPERKNIGEWQEASFVYATNFTTTTSGSYYNGIYFNFGFESADEKSIVNVDIDNVLIEKLDVSYVYFDHTEGKDGELILGNEGDAITYTKKPKYFSYDFTGWYLDAACTVPFTQKTFTADTQLVVYAGWKPADTITYTFESYNIPHRGEVVGKVQRRESFQKTFSKARSGNKVIQMKRDIGYTDRVFFVVANDETPFKIDMNCDYVVTLHYYVEKHSPGGAFVKMNYALGNNHYAYTVDSMQATKISTNEKTGVWHSANFLISGKKIENKGADGIYFSLTGGAGGTYYFDDIVIKRVADGNTAIVIDSDGCPKMPTSFIGKPGTSFANKLPEIPVYEGKFFKGYFIKNPDGTYAELKREDMKLTKESFVVHARFIDSVVTENFDTGIYEYQSSTYGTLKIFDFDYEIYDSRLPGNSKDNVTSGDYSLHRKGESPYNEAAILLTLGNDIAPDHRYTVSFKVKMGQHKHTNGAIKVVSSRSYLYPWDTMGEFYPVVAIADLTDGQWHEVSYTFNSVEAFASIVVPGDIEVYIDDVTFTEASALPLSTPINFTEHITELPDLTFTLDISTIVDVNLDAKPTMNIWLIIGTAAAVLIAGTVIVLFVIKKKKSKKA